MRAVRLRIEGRVQGVGYRFWAEQTANDLGLRGWVRNRRDGAVEILAIGEEAAVAELIESCRDGPPAARVTQISVEEAEDEGAAGFTAKPTI